MTTSAMLPTAKQCLAAFVVCMAFVMWFQSAASLNRSSDGITPLKRPIQSIRTPPWGRKHYTPLGWRYRRISFVFEALSVIAGMATIWLWPHR